MTFKESKVAPTFHYKLRGNLFFLGIQMKVIRCELFSPADQLQVVLCCNQEHRTGCGEVNDVVCERRSVLES